MKLINSGIDFLAIIKNLLKDKTIAIVHRAIPFHESCCREHADSKTAQLQYR